MRDCRGHTPLDFWESPYSQVGLCICARTGNFYPEQRHRSLAIEAQGPPNLIFKNLSSGIARCWFSFEVKYFPPFRCLLFLLIIFRPGHPPPPPPPPPTHTHSP